MWDETWQSYSAIRILGKWWHCWSVNKTEQHWISSIHSCLPGDSHESFHRPKGAQMLLWCCLAPWKGQKGTQLMELHYSVSCELLYLQGQPENCTSDQKSLQEWRNSNETAVVYNNRLHIYTPNMNTGMSISHAGVWMAFQDMSVSVYKPDRVV